MSKRSTRPQGAKPDLSEPSNLVAGYTEAAQSASTRRCYALALRHFLASGGAIPASPQALAEYLARFAKTHAVATLKLRMVAIHKAHVDAGLTSPMHDPLVKNTMQGIRRTKGTDQRRVTALTREDLVEMSAAIESDTPMRSARDIAILLLGFSTALRRSELVRLKCEDITHIDEGVEINVRKSKTDQEGAGRIVFVPWARGARCPVKALVKWLALSGISSSWIFRRIDRNGRLVGSSHLSAQTVAAIVKAAIAVTRGLAAASTYAGHSMRAGYATEAAMMGLPSYQIREQLGHRSEATLAKYIRPSVRRKIPSLL